MSELVPFVEKFVAAYNAEDTDTLAAMLHPDIHLVHHGREARAVNRAEMMDSIELYCHFFPGRRYKEIGRIIPCGAQVIWTSSWEGVVGEDPPDGMSSGQVVEMEICSIFTVADDTVVSWDDWG
jgi:hypothetical protein